MMYTISEYESTEIIAENIKELFRICHIDAMKNESEQLQFIIMAMVEKECSKKLMSCSDNILKYIITWDDGTIIGHFSVKLFSEFIELANVVVHPDYQKLGIGSHIIEETIRIAKTHNFRIIRLWTMGHLVPAIRLYKKFGFVEPEKLVLLKLRYIENDYNPVELEYRL